MFDLEERRRTSVTVPPFGRLYRHLGSLCQWRKRRTIPRDFAGLSTYLSTFIGVSSAVCSQLLRSQTVVLSTVSSCRILPRCGMRSESCQ
jgi:hypothetical protein